MPESSPQRIAIIRFSALGDIVHSLPAYSILRNTFPSSHITWFVHPGGAPLLSLVDGLNAIEVITLKGIPLHDRIGRLFKTLKRYRHQFDLVIDFQGLIKSAVFSALLGGKRIGFAKPDLREPAGACCYTHHPAPFQGSHVIDRNIHLLSALNILPPYPINYSLRTAPPDPNDLYSQAVINLVSDLSQPLCLINLGGAWATKQFEAGFWISLLKNLSRNIKPVLIWGSDPELALARQIAEKHSISISPFLTFSDLIWLISRSKTLVSSDSLALHLADALNVPSVGLFGPTDPARNGSRLSKSQSIRANIPCEYCYKRECDKMWCQQNLSPIEAAALVNEVAEQHD